MVPFPDMSRLRALVALVAAYGFALQALLTGVLVAEMSVAAADPSVICYGAPGDDQHQPTKNHAAHQNCILCSVVSTTALPPQPGVDAVLRRGGTVAFSGRFDTSPPLRRLHSPRSSQGPPQVA